MKDRYDGVKGKESSMMKSRQMRYQNEHDAANAFVKKKQAEVRNLAGKVPNVKPESMDFCSYMSNNGEHAQEFARSLTSGLDKKAFPVK